MVDAAVVNFTRDWSGSREHWPELFAQFTGRELAIMEVGCFEGQATRWFLENFPSAHVTVVDPFDAYPEQRRTFGVNVNEFGPRCRVVVSHSQNELRFHPSKLYDVIYIDGDHSAPAVLGDAVDAFRLAVSGGWLLFDDYDDTGATPGVRPAVDAFVSCYAPLLTVAYRVGRDQFLVVKR